MATIQITWDQFITNNVDARGVRYKFEDLCRQLFVNEFLPKNSYLHSNPNNPGLESDPAYDTVNNRWIGYQAKFFDDAVNYDQILHSAEQIVKHYAGKVDYVYLFCNKALKVTSSCYAAAEKTLATQHITLQPITNDAILDLVRKYPYLQAYYFGKHALSHQWFVEHTKRMLDELGERYNRELNVGTKTAQYLSLFTQDERAIDYLNGKKRELIDRIGRLDWRYESYWKYYRKILEEVLRLADVDFVNISEALNWEKQIKEAVAPEIKNLSDELGKAESELEKLDTSLLEDGANKKESNEIRTKVYSLERKCEVLNTLLDLPNSVSLSVVEQSALLGKILVVKGEAGIGKSQLFACETTSLVQTGQNALLLLGGTYLADVSIQEQIVQNLPVDFSVSDLVDILEVIGANNNRIVPIFIDALNETWNHALWKSELPLIMDKVRECSHVRLAVSYRPEYERLLLNDTLIAGIASGKITCLVHRGFRDDPINAVEQFLDHYGIPFTAVDYFNGEMTNPLFLTLYCKTYQGDEVDLPTLYDRILEYANTNTHKAMAKSLRNSGYIGTEDLLGPFVEEFSKYIYTTGRKSIPKQEILDFEFWRSYAITPAPFISSLIKEHILHDLVYDGKQMFYFSYDQMNDYYCAKAILSDHESKEAVRHCLMENVLAIKDGQIENYGNIDLFVNACALYAEKYHEECIDILDGIADEYEQGNIFSQYIASYRWRGRNSIQGDKLLDLLKTYPIRASDVWNMLIDNSVKLAHPLNADFLHEMLSNYKLSYRDYIWTDFINYITEDDTNRVVQLIQMYNAGESLAMKNEKQLELLLTLFGWLLTSSDRLLRDLTSKAMIELLKRNFSLCEVILAKFQNVDDPYVVQRLYGVVFGACCKRKETSIDLYQSLSEYVYHTVFDQEQVYPDILLRDYARLIVERFLWENPGYCGCMNRSKIVPPYFSVPIPTVEEQDYDAVDYSSGTHRIISSMQFEGMGMYGDFGRYVFQSALRDFDVEQKNIFHYAVSFILNDLGYQEDTLGKIDKGYRYRSHSRHDTIKVERIGKKYQWIAMYNILARVSDHCKRIEGFGKEKTEVPFEGAWEPYVRDFDPTLNNNFMKYPHAPRFEQIDRHIAKACEENAVASKKKDKTAWMETDSNFFDDLKSDLVAKDDSGREWICLTRHVDTGFEEMKTTGLQSWSWVYGFMATEEQVNELVNASNQGVDLRSDELSQINETYSVFNREYPWSPSCNELRCWNWKEVDVETDETEIVTEKVMVPDFSAIDEFLKKFGYTGDSDDGVERADQGIPEDDFKLPDVQFHERTIERRVKKTIGKILAAATYLMWEEQYDASKEAALSWMVPCPELIEELHLYQLEYDGYYFDEHGDLAAFDTSLNKQKAGLVIRKDLLDTFLSKRGMKLVWLVNGSKEIHNASLQITKWSEWTSVLAYDGVQALGDIHKVDQHY